MFENTGSKLKVFALVMFWLSFIGSIISGLILIFNGLFLVGIVTVGAGFLVAFLLALPMFALADAAISAQDAVEEIEELKKVVGELRRNLQAYGLKNPTIKPAENPAKPAAPTRVPSSMAAAKAAYNANTEKLQNDL